MRRTMQAQIICAGLGLALYANTLTAAHTIEHASEKAKAASAGETQPTAQPAEPDSKPAAPLTTVHIGVHIIDVRGLDMRAQSFFADFYLWLRFATSDEERAKLIVDKFEAMNGKFDAKEEVDRKQIGEQTYVCFRMNGTFNFAAKLQRYPFDVQALELVFENATLETDAVRFADDLDSYRRSTAPERLWGVKTSLNIPEFHLDRVERLIADAVYPTDFGDPTRMQAESKYSRFVVSMQFRRDYMPYLFKIIIPLMLILGMTYLVFWLPPDQMYVSSAMAITALLACMAFNISVAQNLPEVGYLVVSDKFFIASYILLFVTLLETIVTYLMDKNGQAERGMKVAHWSKFLFPGVAVLIFAYLMIGGLA